MDRFSQLTDDLLIKILSFLPTKDAVATSTLAKRWLSLWTLVPRLNFEDRWVDIEETNEVRLIVLPAHFVSGALLLNRSPVLERFHLSRAIECSASEIDLWVRIAVDRFVRDLKISFVDDFHCLIRLPSRLFRCETLETLELRKVSFLDVPSRFSLRSLRTLRLLSVKYADEESFVRFISSAPVLENLAVQGCSDDNVPTFTINVPSLLSLSVRNILQDPGPCHHLYVIHSHSSLKHLEIVNEFGDVNVIGKMSKLVEASLPTLEDQVTALESLTTVKRLSLTLDGVAPQYPIGNVFFQLVRLEFRGCDVKWSDLLVHVLQHSPVLQILKIIVLYDERSNFNRNVEDDKVCWIQPICVPECLFFHLETFEWREYEGAETQKEVAVYILKNARRLVTATVFPDSLRGGQRRVFDELEFATRGSRACELTLG
ncbi:unnamed protein product [Microthlaspi erraticum]|uniref:FBD domain-containing protein n=1 Tax=Microthlaspi erraticum TaxID=1685480 RepID=A0A6D2LPT8_9BRAS|nr:unnamed protein product [Microthlaspi erraticum]